MRDIYIICMVIGFLLLSLSVLGEFLENVSGALEAFLNFDFDIDLNFLPISGVSICTGLIAFGGMGLLSDFRLSRRLRGRDGGSDGHKEAEAGGE